LVEAVFRALLNDSRYFLMLIFVFKSVRVSYGR
jgi:hypothetical protein